MSGLVVCDASAVVAALLDAGEHGQWAAGRMTGQEVFAPTVLPYECANVIRRQQRAGTVSPDQAAQAHADLLDLPIDYWPYHALAERIWELHDNLSSYDAAYVALAEAIGAPLVTLDCRLANAPGARCAIDCYTRPLT